MNNKLTAEVSITINAMADEVWEVLTNPDLIKQYLFDTTVVSDWKVGGPITYEGEFKGKLYKDKGTILKMEAPVIFQCTNLNSMSGKEDKPENYNTITYQLEEMGEQTKLTVTHDNLSSEAEQIYSTNNWNDVLNKLKEVVEKNRVGSPYRTII